MSIARKCDMCGKLYEEYNTEKDEKNPNGIMFLNIVTPGSYFKHGEIDCCPECMAAIKGMFNSQKAEQRYLRKNGR